MENRIGDVWETLEEAQADLEVVEGVVTFGDIQKNIPWNNGLIRMPMYIKSVDEYGNETDDEEEKFVLDFVETEDGVKLVDVN